MFSLCHLKKEDVFVISQCAEESGFGTRLFKIATALLERHKGTLLRVIQEKVDVSVRTLSNWFSKYTEMGLPGLFNSKRSGRPTSAADTDSQIHDLVTNTQPINQSCWTAKSIANALNLSKSTVDHSLSRQNIDLVKMRPCTALLPSMKDKTLSLVGLFMTESTQICVVAAQEESILVKQRTDSGDLPKSLLKNCRDKLPRQ